MTDASSQAESAAGERTVLIVDDHPLVRQGIGILVNGEEDLTICGEAASAHEALRAMEACEPDLAVVDLSLKDSSGLELIKDIQIRFPNVRVLVLSMRDEGFYAERALRAGALGYVTKEEPREKVIEGIRKVLAGQVYVSEKIATKVMGKIVAGHGDGDQTAMDSLTDRELEVFELIGRGMATREIAKKLHISPKTVDSHREHVKNKLQLDTAADLAKHAIQWVQCQRNI